MTWHEDVNLVPVMKANALKEIDPEFKKDMGENPFKMKCDKCGKDFPENKIEDSHNIPCYLFEGKNRREIKQQADKHERHWLCKDCHHRYETTLCATLIKNLPLEIKEKMRHIAKRFSERWFK